jgi:hypothetical protein
VQLGGHERRAGMRVLKASDRSYSVLHRHDKQRLAFFAMTETEDHL